MDKKNIGRGATILTSGNSKKFKTGSWKNRYPSHSKEGCIKQKDGILQGMDLNFCKGCGVCANVCPFKAIEMKEI